MNTPERLHSDNLAEALKLAIEARSKEEKRAGCFTTSAQLQTWMNCLDGINNGVLPIVDWAHAR